MPQTQSDTPSKPRKQKNWAVINGSCKMAKLSDGYAPKSCPDCGLNHKLKICPWCGYVRGRNEHNYHAIP